MIIKDYTTLNLDDLTYDDLMKDALLMLQQRCPERWTDHNPSDPGIMLLELFAWMAESLIYRCNRIPEKNYRTFLTLLGHNTPTSGALQDDLRGALLSLRERVRAITPDDYVHLITNVWPLTDDATRTGSVEIIRVICAPNRNFERPDPVKRYEAAVGHLSIVVMTKRQVTIAESILVMGHLANLRKWIDERRMLGTFVHVTSPRYVRITVAVKLIVNDDSRPMEQIKADASSALGNKFDPTARPFGRDVFISEINGILDGITDVDHIEDVILSTTDNTVNRELLCEGNLIGLRLFEDELANLEPVISIAAS